MREIPEQRIVSEELWAAVQARIETVKQVYGEIGSKGGMQGRSVNSLYLWRKYQYRFGSLARSQ